MPHLRPYGGRGYVWHVTSPDDFQHGTFQHNYKDTLYTHFVSQIHMVIINYGERVLVDRIPSCTFFETSTHNCIFFVLLLYLLLKTTQSSPCLLQVGIPQTQRSAVSQSVLLYIIYYWHHYVAWTGFSIILEKLELIMEVLWSIQ